VTAASHPALSSSAFERVERALREYGSRRTSRRDWNCPAHDDHTPSLSVNQGERGVVLHCHAGCSVNEVAEALGLELTDLFDESARKLDSGIPPIRERRAADSYLYTDRMERERLARSAEGPGKSRRALPAARDP
jgi:hypothetical protein